MLSNNTDAAALAGCSWSPLRVVKQHLCIDSDGANALLNDYVQRTMQAPHCGIDIPLAHPCLRARVMTLQTHAAWAMRSLHLLTVSGKGKSMNFVALGMRLQLTPAEAGLVAALCEGTSLVDYASRRRIKGSTARTQMKSAMHKLGVHSQLGAVLLMMRIAHAKD